MSPRFTSDLQRLGLKTHLKRVLAQLGGIDAAASCTRVVRSKLAEYADASRPERHVPVDVLLDLELAAGAPLLTEALAAAQGFTLLPQHVGEGDLAERLARVSQDAGQTMADAVRALRHGMPDAERDGVISDLAVLMRDSGEALALLRQGAADRLARSFQPSQEA